MVKDIQSRHDRWFRLEDEIAEPPSNELLCHIADQLYEHGEYYESEGIIHYSFERKGNELTFGQQYLFPKMIKHLRIKLTCKARRVTNHPYYYDGYHEEIEILANNKIVYKQIRLPSWEGSINHVKTYKPGDWEEKLHKLATQLENQTR